MIFLRKPFLCFLACICFVSVFGQQFPGSWQGHWVGKLYIYSKGEIQDTVKMQLNIDSLDETSYTWQLIYGPDPFDGLRDYKLLVDDSLKNRYWIDEQNSIVLPANYVDNRLLSCFNVADNLVFVQYMLRDEKMYVEISSAPFSSANESGGELVDGEEVPAVSGYDVRIFQTAILEKVR